MIPMQEPVTEFKLEAPAGLIGIHAECRNGKVTQVTFENVPAFSVHLDAVLDVPELGKVIVDVAWGGMFYVIADVTQFDALDLVPERGRDITRVGALILRAAQDQLPVEHPDYPGVGITIAKLSAPPYESPSNWPFLRTEPRTRLERAVKALFLGFVRNNAYKRPASDPTVWVRT